MTEVPLTPAGAPAPPPAVAGPARPARVGPGDRGGEPYDGGERAAAGHRLRRGRRHLVPRRAGRRRPDRAAGPDRHRRPGPAGASWSTTTSTPRTRDRGGRRHATRDRPAARGRGRPGAAARGRRRRTARGHVAGRGVARPGDRVETESPRGRRGAAGARRTTAAGEDAIALQAASTSAPRPTIFTREQWGADERMRDGRPSYGSISAGFVHHTVNANDYSRDDVPGMLRSIYAYHTQSRGWSDIGYNFLVDKFGRIWEGRYGGVARPVVGAHTLGYNDDSFAMSAIGNFETARPRRDAPGVRRAVRLEARPGGHRPDGPLAERQRHHLPGDQRAPRRRLDRLPGPHLYEKLPAIRRYAAEAEEPVEPEEPDPVTLRQVDSDLASTPYPDLVVRRASDGAAWSCRPAGSPASAPRRPGRSAGRAQPAGHPRPHRGRPGRPGDLRRLRQPGDPSRPGRRRLPRGGPGPAASAATTWSPRRATSTGTAARTSSPGRGRPGHLPADPEGRLPPGRAGHRAAGLRAARGRRGRHRRR